MAKGDAKRVNTAIDAAQSQSNTARTGLGTTAMTGYNNAVNNSTINRDLARGALGESQQGFTNYLSGQTPSPYLAEAFGNARGLGGSNATFNEFANTGGFSPQDAQNFRARGNSPISAAYSNARDEMMRGNALQGGYGGNFAAGQSQLARQGGAAASQQGLLTEASLADQIRAGRLGGAQGQAGLAGTGAGIMGSLAQGQDSNRLNAMQGLTGVGNAFTNLYGTQDPALGYLNAGMNNQTGQFGANEGLIGQRIQASQIPSNFQQGIGNVGSVLGLLGKGASALSGLTGMAKNPNQVYNSQGYDSSGNYQDPWAVGLVEM